MTEQYFFADTETGLAHAFRATLSLRRAGFKTRLAETLLHRTRLHVLYATSAPRPNRKTRGCSGR